MPTITIANYALAWLAAGALGGLVIGVAKRRVAYAVVLGAVLGPLGWVIAALSAGRCRACPACAAQIPLNAKFCPKCGVSIAKAEQRSARSALRGEMR
jgi:hypothetical protein